MSIRCLSWIWLLDPRCISCIKRVNHDAMLSAISDRTTQQAFDIALVSRTGSSVRIRRLSTAGVSSYRADAAVREAGVCSPASVPAGWESQRFLPGPEPDGDLTSDHTLQEHRCFSLHLLLGLKWWEVSGWAEASSGSGSCSLDTERDDESEKNHCLNQFKSMFIYV